MLWVDSNLFPKYKNINKKNIIIMHRSKTIWTTIADEHKIYKKKIFVLRPQFKLNMHENRYHRKFVKLWLFKNKLFYSVCSVRIYLIQDKQKNK